MTHKSRQILEIMGIMCWDIIMILSSNSLYTCVREALDFEKDCCFYKLEKHVLLPRRYNIIAVCASIFFFRSPILNSHSDLKLTGIFTSI